MVPIQMSPPQPFVFCFIIISLQKQVKKVIGCSFFWVKGISCKHSSLYRFNVCLCTLCVRATPGPLDLELRTRRASGPCVLCKPSHLCSLGTALGPCPACRRLLLSPMSSSQCSLVHFKVKVNIIFSSHIYNYNI